MNPKTRKVIGWILTGILALLMLFSAFMKLSGNEEAVKGSAALGISGSTLMWIGIIELVSTLLFIYPRTGILGTLLLAAYLGGAIATHLEHAQPLTMPVIVECVLWITAAIRFPELTRRLRGTSDVH
jgi:hypothetical protein